MIRQTEDSVQSQFSSLSLQAFSSFASLADLHNSSVNAWEEKVHEALRLFEKLWSFQSEHREALFLAGVTPAHIGDIAMRNAQLHFGLYMHSGSPDRLITACTWAEGIVARGYFDHDQSQDSSKKKLRVYARFILALLFLDRREEVWNLLIEIEAMIAANASTQATSLVNEISSFLASDIAMPVPISPGSKLIFRPNLRCPSPNQDSPVFTKHVRRLRDALFVSHVGADQLKIAELSLDSYRMMVALEWRDVRLSSSPLPPPSSLTMSLSSDIATLCMPNRHHRHQSSPLNIISLLGNLIASLPPPTNVNLLTPSSKDSYRSPEPDLTLIHIVGKGHWGQINIPIPSSSSLSPSPPGIDGLSLDDSKPKAPSNQVKLPLGVFVSSPADAEPITSSWESLLSPDDIFPFTRRRLLLVVDSDASSAFLSPHFVRGCSSVAPMCLLSPSHRPSAFLAQASTGSIFTLGLTCPLMAFCLMMGEKKPIESAKLLIDLEAAIEHAETKIAEALSSPLSSPTSPWLAAWEDVLTRRLVVRFALLRSAFYLHQASRGRSDCQCICTPTLPSVAHPGSALLKDLIYSISKVIEGREKLFGL